MTTEDNEVKKKTFHREMGILRRARKRKRLSIKELAAWTGVSTQSIRSIEYMTYVPSCDKAEQLASFLGIRAEDLFADIVEWGDEDFRREAEKRIKMLRMFLEYHKSMMQEGIQERINEEDKDVILAVREYMKRKLNDRERQILDEWSHGWSMAHIGRLLGLSVSRIAQIKNKAIAKTRAGMSMTLLSMRSRLPS